jgi:hypothetical protein
MYKPGSRSGSGGAASFLAGAAGAAFFAGAGGVVVCANAHAVISKRVDSRFI